MKNGTHIIANDQGRSVFARADDLGVRLIERRKGSEDRSVWLSPSEQRVLAELIG